MKFLLIASTLLTSHTAFATSPYMGPWLSQSIGNVQKGEGVYCLITPTSVRITNVADGTSKTFELNLDAKDLGNKIAAASTAPQRRALHFIATNPPVTIEAGDAYEGVNKFELLKDASALEYRDSSDAAELIELVKENCSK